MKISGRMSLIVVVLLCAGCAQAPESLDTRAADQASIRLTIRQWSDSAAT